MILADKIINERKKNGWSQEELADKINVSKSAIAKWETDAGIPDRDNLQRLAKAIGVSCDDLYRIIGAKNIEDVDLEINITPEVIAALESYGYKVIRPGSRENDSDISETL